MVVPNTTIDTELPKKPEEPKPKKKPGLLRRLIGRAARAYGRGRENAARRGGRLPLRRTPRAGR